MTMTVVQRGFIRCSLSVYAVVKLYSHKPHHTSDQFTDFTTQM